VRHVLVTNDFPPKVGGIQSYLWELWRRLPADEVTVLTAAHPQASAFDAGQPFRVERTGRRLLLPGRSLGERVSHLASEVGAGLVVLDPALPLGLLGHRLGLPYAVVLHGAEVTVPGRLPGTRSALAHVLRGADRVIAAGGYPAAEGRRAAGSLPPTTVVAPGVDADRFRPLDDNARARARADLGLPAAGPLLVSLSRLVPRKGMDTLIEAAALMAPTRPDLTVAIAGEGRDGGRLERLARRLHAPVRFLGRVPEERLPALYGCADVFVMLCRNRWAGLEQEGFGIVFLEAGACGVPVVAGDSGGAGEAVVHGETGMVVPMAADRPGRARSAAEVLSRLLDDPGLRARLGEAGRQRVEAEFRYDDLAATLRRALS